MSKRTFLMVIDERVEPFIAVGFWIAVFFVGLVLDGFTLKLAAEIVATLFSVPIILLVYEILIKR